MHDLALALGKTTGELEASMTARELNDWLAYMRETPLPHVAENIRHGLLCCLLANINRGANKPAYKPEDFIPFIKKPEVTLFEFFQRELGDG